MDCPVNQTTDQKVDSRRSRGGASWDRWLIPSRCLVCDERGQPDRDLCAACQADLRWNRACCRRCGLPLPQASDRCGRCLRVEPPYQHAEAPLIYGFPVDRLLPRFKFHGDLAAGRLLADLFVASLPPRPAGAWPQALLPVPLHTARLRQRGYDQALELAKPIAATLGIPLRADGLQRQRHTGAQSELGAGARRRNVRGAFRCGLRVLPSHVAVIDDVMTTGATLGECARVLRAAGVATVELWVVARAPPRHQGVSR